jgi:hypothetical protein
VSPTIHFLTPSEWPSAPRQGKDPRGKAIAPDAFNRERTAKLPEGVRHQFHLLPFETRSEQASVRPARATSRGAPLVAPRLEVHTQPAMISGERKNTAQRRDSTRRSSEGPSVFAAVLLDTADVGSASRIR